jgi:CRP-like cAMP-binding protein
VNIFTSTKVLRDFPHATTRVYDAGQIILYEGDQPNHVMFVKSGAIKFFDTDRDGNEKILHIGGEGSIAPLFYSFEDKKAVDAFYAALTKTEVLLVPLEDFRFKLRESAEYTYRVLRWYAEEMDHIVLRLKSLEKSTAKQKILQALYYLSDQHSSADTTRGTWQRINFPVTQQILANLTGLTRETVNIILNDPECLKYVRSNSRQRFEINKSKIATLLTN